jgi:hypothetical protein
LCNEVCKTLLYFGITGFLEASNFSLLLVSNITMSELWAWLLVVLIIGCLFALLHLLETKEGFEAQTATELEKAIQQAMATPVVSQPLSAESQKIMNMLKQNTAETKVAGTPSSSSGSGSSGSGSSSSSNVPNNADTTRSSPSSANITSPTSPVLQQGAVAQKYLAPEPKIIMVPVPSNERPASSCPSTCPPPCSKPCPKSCDVPEPKKACRPPKWEPGMPVPDYCPTMPDMKDYIRKDSIPCWACKL